MDRLSSDGAGALGDPQGESHGARLGDCLSGATLSERLLLEGGTASIGGTDEHVASDLEGLLLSHGRLSVVDLISIEGGRGREGCPVDTP